MYNYSYITLLAAAERKELYRFSVDLGKLALRIAERHGTNADRWYVPLASYYPYSTYSSAARWSCIVPWSPPMKTYISGQISPDWRKPPNTRKALVTGA